MPDAKVSVPFSPQMAQDLKYTACSVQVAADFRYFSSVFLSVFLVANLADSLCRAGRCAAGMLVGSTFAYFKLFVAVIVDRLTGIGEEIVLVICLIGVGEHHRIVCIPSGNADGRTGRHGIADGQRLARVNQNFVSGAVCVGKLRQSQSALG